MTKNQLNIGDKVLITTSEWFYCPDGNQYRAVWGTIHGVYSDDQVLGIKTNRHSTNWYVTIGNMTVAGCQIFYAMKTETPPNKYSQEDNWHEGEVHTRQVRSSVFNADEVKK